MLSSDVIKYVAVPVSLAVALGLIRKWRSRNWAKCTSNTCLRGKTFLITGATSGIGLETARALVKRKARVIFACRDIDKAKKVVAEIRTECDGGELIPMQLDLASFTSIEKFVDVVKAGFYKIDVLINNAGVAIPLQLDQKTKEGFEIHLGVNHLGHFYLTNLLIDLLKKAAPSRIVIVTSTLHEKAKLDFDNLYVEDQIEKAKLGKRYRHNPGYCNSKLMNLYHARALAAKYRNSGIDVYLPAARASGAETVLHCATDYRLEGHTGKMYRNCTEYRSTYRFSKGEENKLWEVSEALVKARRPI
ncbi:putative restnol dehydrogenase [Danaus plexippus plexippus]|uniref:Restnol dehydrogenase n=1 Tax=Danaus plexippus plexippus TaxID=278856 RepID=A0A212ERM8_DANPL|nr:putative restnol dehydrogenase [Danaus plexippus plexippus]